MGSLQTGSVLSSNSGLVSDLIQVVQAAPADPTGTTTTSVYVMMGLGALTTGQPTITPKSTGRLLVICNGSILNATTGDGASVVMAYGTGTAPANAAAAAGTTFGNTFPWTSLTGITKAALPLVGFATGLTVGTAYWIDLQVKAVTGGTAQPTGLNFVIIEF